MASLATIDHVSVAVGAAALIIVYTVYRRYTSISLGDVPGPEPASFIMGISIPFYWFSTADVTLREHEGALPRAGRGG
jgi:hypothetical protein